MSASLGLALYPWTVRTPRRLVKNAGAAMHFARIRDATTTSSTAGR